MTDTTGTLDAEHRAALESELAAFEQQKGSQIAVLMVPTTRPETIEQYGIRVGEAWKIGRKGVDDGAILIVAKDDRRVRIEVGYGLEGALNDAITKRIISETITPQFKRNDFAGGIERGINQMIWVINGESLPPLRRTAASGSTPEDMGELSTLMFLFDFFLFWLPWRLFGFKRAALLCIGLSVLAAYADTSSWVGVLTRVPFTAFVWFVGAFYLLSKHWQKPSRSRSSSSSSSSSDSSGSSSGGFSGGGGSFGGGGASGSW